MAKGMKAAFEKSRFDNDKGVKEGSPADLKRDKKQMPAFLRAGAGGGGPPQAFKKGGRVGKGRGR